VIRSQERRSNLQKVIRLRAKDSIRTLIEGLVKGEFQEKVKDHRESSST
jgi:hypothetical protein